MVVLSPQFVAAHRETKSVLQVFDRYSASLTRQRFEEAYEYCGADFRNAMSYNQFVSLHQSLQAEFGSLRSVQRSAYDVHGSGTPTYWRAVINADFVYDRKTLKFQYVFRKEKNRWVLFGSEQL
jgi:hypothetical protein